jgi:hypothetical protein
LSDGGQGSGHEKAQKTQKGLNDSAGSFLCLLRPFVAIG